MTRNFFNAEKAAVLIPEHMHGGLERYLNNGIYPGDFLMAVLSNDLKEAVARADHLDLNALPNYVCYLYNYAPMGSWGSPAKVQEWVKSFESND